MLRSQTEQADELPESGPREHDVPFVLHRAPWVGFAHYSRSCPPLSLSCVHVHVHVVLLTLAWSWQLMFRVCAPARAGLLCALRVLFVHLEHSVCPFVLLEHAADKFPVFGCVQSPAVASESSRAVLAKPCAVVC